MNSTDFFELILPSEGYYCVLGMKKDAPIITSWHDNIQSAASEAEKLNIKEYNAYFACSSYKEKTKRNQPNVHYVRSNWLDIDCGVGKSYEDQEQGLEALVKFCTDLELSTPTVVSSGYGIHAYWAHDADAGPDEWKHVADTLKAKCVEYGLKADPAVTADIARILRVPGTNNYKRETPVGVTVLLKGVVTTWLEFRTALGVSLIGPMPDYISREQTPLQKQLQESRRTKFSIILDKSDRGIGCNQIKNIYENQDTVDYNLWRAGLSIAVNCADANEAIHKISDKHPEYDYDKTQRKAEDLLDKPYLCKTIEVLNPAGCKKCPHRKDIKSPIVLGTEIIEADDEDPVEYVTKRGSVETYVPGRLPNPYKRGKNGGIFFYDKGSEIFKNVYEHDLYLVKRVQDPDKGDSVIARLHLPREPMREFIIPLPVLTSGDEVRKLLSFHGVIAPKPQMEIIAAYLMTCAKQQQLEQDIEILRTQFGWADSKSKFILGSQEISAAGTRYSPPASGMERLAKCMEPRGSVDLWKRAINVYNKPGLEAHSFAAFTGFGSPLMAFTNYNGMLISLLSPESGTGKTTILKVCNSIMGHPEGLLSKESDTFNHKILTLGFLNNIAYTCDEVTNMSNELISKFVYSTTQGEGPGRVESGANRERKNDTRWSTISMVSTNSSLIQKLQNHRLTSAGELMRIFEIPIPPTAILSKHEAYEIFEGTLYSNYGVAGEIFINYIVKNREVVIKRIFDTQQEIDKLVDFNNTERYHSITIACNITGARIAKELGLHDIDIDRVIRWITKNLVPMARGNITHTNDIYKDVLGEFLNSHRSFTAIVKDAVDNRTNLHEAPIQEPWAELQVRVEIDTKKIYVATRLFKKFCNERQIILKDFLDKLMTDGVYEGETRKRLGKGTKLNTPAVHCCIFSYADDDLFGAESLVEDAKKT